MIEVLKQALEFFESGNFVYPTKIATDLRQAIAELESQEPVAHCEAGPEFCQQCHKESLPTYGSEEVSKLREVIQSQAKIIADYEKQIDEPAIYPEEAYEMGLEAIAYYTHPPQRTEQNFCPRCGKRTNDIHTCTPPQRTEQEPVGFAGIEVWIGNTRIKKLMTQTELHSAIDPWAIVKFHSDSCIDALKEKNT
jgi:hypothetical protein